MMPGPQLKFRSIFHSLCKRLYVTWCQHKNPSTFTLFETGDEIEADIPGSLCSQAAVAAKCHHFHFAFDELDNKVSRFPDSPIVIPSSPPKGLLKPTSPTVTIEATEVRSESFSDEDLEGLYDRELEHIGPDLVPRMRTAEWIYEGDSYLAEFMWREGRGKHTTDSCFGCRKGLGGGGYRCMDCSDGALYCAPCTVSNHIRQCLHRIQTWNGQYFNNFDTLKKLGMRVQLGHPPGERCQNPVVTLGADFTVIDVSGFHKVCVDFCGCDMAVRPHSQLLRYGWFPATTINPTAAATFSLLNLVQLLSRQCKASASEFYATLVSRTDNTGVSQPRDLYPCFLLMVKMWCFVKVMKHAGRGNDPGGIPATPRGACVVECPACPRQDMDLFEYRSPKLQPLVKGLDSSASSINRISPGSLHDLSDVFGDRMWHIITTMPTMFLSEIEVAVHDRATHRETFDRLSNSIDAKRTTKFSTMVMDADTNHAAILHELEQEPLLHEWWKARALVKRCDDQVQVLLEEMRRVVSFHARKAEWWEDQSGRTFLEQPQYLEGADAYAYRQASIRRLMASHCLHSWRFVTSYVALGGDEQFFGGDGSFDIGGA